MWGGVCSGQLRHHDGRSTRQSDNEHCPRDYQGSNSATSGNGIDEPHGRRPDFYRLGNSG
jgi:hypothetical protein